MDDSGSEVKGGREYMGPPNERNIYLVNISGKKNKNLPKLGDFILPTTTLLLRSNQNHPMIPRTKVIWWCFPLLKPPGFQKNFTTFPPRSRPRRPEVKAPRFSSENQGSATRDYYDHLSLHQNPQRARRPKCWPRPYPSSGWNPRSAGRKTRCQETGV